MSQMGQMIQGSSSRIHILNGAGAVTLPGDPMYIYQLQDRQRRMRNILNKVPARSWDLDEYDLVLDVFARLLRERGQARCDVISLLGEAQFSDQLEGGSPTGEATGQLG